MTMSKTEQKKILEKQFFKYTGAVPKGGTVSVSHGDWRDWNDTSWGDLRADQEKSLVDSLRETISRLSRENAALIVTRDTLHFNIVHQDEEAKATLEAVKAAHMQHQAGMAEQLRLEMVKVAALEKERDALLQAMSILGVSAPNNEQE